MIDIKQALVVITIVPNLEEPLIDWLLGREQPTGFTSMTVYGHGSRHEYLSTAEQVSGRQRRVQFQIEMAMDQVEPFVQELRTDFEGAHMRYRIQPLYSPDE